MRRLTLQQPACPRAAALARRQRGFTLVELMVVVALTAILLAVAVPSFSQLVAKMRIEGATNNLSTDLQLARTEAVQRRANVSLTTNADGSSYSITSGAITIKTVTFSGGLTFTGGVTITFEPLRGLANAATLTSSGPAGVGLLRISSDVMGRVQMCSPDGQFKGYGTC
jgi:type IV fimbrial biogenesis protein FimT